MYIYLQCSNCGKKHRISNKKVKYIINAIKKGWRSFGSALYCPECSETWNDRNNKLINDERDTFFVIMKWINAERSF